MKIGKLADATGVTVSSIRFYEKHGLIPSPMRRENGYRDYPDTTVERLRTITISKSLGFSLSEIKRFLPDNPETSIPHPDVILNLEQKLQDVDQKIRELKEVKRKLIGTIQHMKDPDSDSC